MARLIFAIIEVVISCISFAVEFCYSMTTNSNQSVRVTAKIIMVTTIVSGIIYFLYVYSNRDIVAYNKLTSTVSIEKYQNFIDNYPQSDMVKEAERMIDTLYRKELLSIKDSAGYSNYIKKYSSNYRYKEKYKKEHIENAINALGIETKRLEDLRKKKERERLKKEAQNWDTEYAAWNTASRNGTIEAYKKYLSLYPKGSHVATAQKRLIDLEVSNVFNGGQYGQLPSMNRTHYSNYNYSTITIKNDTQYTLTLLYSGVESKRLVIVANRSQSIRLKAGTYRIVASVDASNVRHFAGSEQLSGGDYEVSYYISRHRY